MGQLYSHYIKWEKNIVVIFQICGAIAIFALFHDDQDTDNEKWEIQISTSKLILNRRNISKDILDNDICTLKIGENTVVIIHIYEARAIFLLFYDDQDT